MKYKCPKCAGTRIGVMVSAAATLMQDDDEVWVDDIRESDWDLTSSMWCRTPSCEFSAMAADFIVNDKEET